VIQKYQSSSDNASDAKTDDASLRPLSERTVNQFEPRTTSDAKQENEEHRVSRGLLHSGKPLPLIFPVGAVVATIIVSCTRTSSSSSASFLPTTVFTAAPVARRRSRVPAWTFLIRAPTSLNSLARSYDPTEEKRDELNCSFERLGHGSADI
jgi:hypothetical protein